MRFQIQHGDILDLPADLLIASANGLLNLSGGVGAAYLQRYGSEMQEKLHAYLRDRGLRHVLPGEVIAMPSCGGPYRAVLHAVAIDAFYETSWSLVAATIVKSLHLAAELGAKTVALAAIGTGYGRLSMSEFAKSIDHVKGLRIDPIEDIVIVLRNQEDVEELKRHLPPILYTPRGQE